MDFLIPHFISDCNGANAVSLSKPAAQCIVLPSQGQITNPTLKTSPGIQVSHGSKAADVRPLQLAGYNILYMYTCECFFCLALYELNAYILDFSKHVFGR